MSRDEKLENKVILITGGTGYLGSHLAFALANYNTKLIVIKRKNSSIDRLQNILNKIIFYDVESIDVEALFKLHAPDVVINCMVNYSDNPKDFTEIINTNLFFPTKLLQCCVNSKKKLIFVNADTTLNRKINAYALSKKQFLEWGKFLAKYSLFFNVCLDHFYGPHDQHFKFYVKLIHNLLSKVDSIDLTSGEQKRDFTYIDDVVNAFIAIIKHAISLYPNVGFHNVEVGSGNVVTIRALASLIKEITKNTNTALNFGALPYRLHEQMECTICSDKLRSYGWAPKYTLEQGLRKTISAEIKNRNEGKLCDT